MIKYWAGSPSTLQDYEACVKKMEAYMASKEYQTRIEDDDWPEPESLYERVGDVGVVKISGHLIPGEASALYQMFGMQGYDNIKSAFVEAIADKKAKRITMHVNSGGGAVDGVRDASEFIKTAAQVKPVNAYGQFACSAAYWLASSGGHMTVGETSIIGSIGVLRVHKEFSKAEEKEGITTTVMRSGKYKALVNPYEPLTEEAKAESQQHLDDMYKIFVQAVADNRGTSYVVADTTMAEGREFLGHRAVEAGLADAVGTFEHTLSANMSGSVAASVVASVALPDNSAMSNLKDTTVKLNLTKEQMEALASGVPLADLVGDKAAAEMEASVDTSKPTDGAEDVVKTEANEADTKLADLQAEVNVLKAEVETLKTELEAKDAEAKVGEETQEALAGVVRASIKQMNIALNRNVDVEAMAHADLVEAYNSTKEALGKTFKSNGVSRTTAKAEEPDQETQQAALLNAKFLAQAKSVKFF